ncbi:MAG: DUF4168 domain-containing protein [Geitlerinemataceae cyanobacterium]
MGQPAVKLWMGTIAAIALSCGLAAGCSGNRDDNPPENEVRENSAAGENPLTAYARSVLDIEPLRSNAYEQIVAVNPDSSPPAVICNDRDTVSALRGEVKTIAVDYCNQAKAIAEQHGLTPEQFNEIAGQVENDPQLKEAIKTELLKLQQPTRPSS